MVKVVGVHTFRGGVGKSTMVANLATALAVAGASVGVVDANLQWPGQNFLYHVEEDDIDYSLNDYLRNKCTIVEASIDLTDTMTWPLEGRLFLVPSAPYPGELGRDMSSMYDIERLGEGLLTLGNELDLDIILVDTPPGLDNATLMLLALADTALVIMRPDRQHYQGTSVLLETARLLEVPHLLLLLNEVSSKFDFDTIAEQIQNTYGVDVVAVLPYEEKIVTLGEGTFVLAYPDNRVTKLLVKVATQLIISASGNGSPPPADRPLAEAEPSQITPQTAPEADAPHPPRSPGNGQPAAGNAAEDTAASSEAED